MTKRERVYAALRGEPVDRVPVALWRHFPEDDQTAEGLAKAVADWQTHFDFDFVKVTPTSGYPIEDWGAEFVYRGNDHGTRDTISRPVRERDDWQSIQPLDVSQGVWGREVEAIRLLRQRLDPDVPMIQTIFSPTYTVKNLAEGDRFIRDLRAYPQDIHSVLKVVTETTIAMATACLEAGADGIFFATQLACSQWLTRDEYETFGVPYDRQVIAAVRDQTDFILLHIHGEDIYFDLLAGYPVEAVNWHDRRTWPSLAQARDIFSGCLVGGLNEEETLKTGRPEEVAGQVRDAIAQTGGRSHIIGAGCVTPIVAPEANVRAARQAVEG